MIKKITYSIALITVFVSSIFIPYTSLFLYQLILFFPVLIFITIAVLIFVWGVLIKNQRQKKYSLLIFLPLVLTVVIQVLSIYSVEKYRKFRSEKLITQLEIYKDNDQSYPKFLNENMKISGIDYFLQKDTEYILSFQKNFLNNEVYYSKTKKWETVPVFD